MRRWGLGAFVLWIVAIGGCSPGSPACWASSNCPGDTACDSDHRCASGACVDGLCAPTCTSSDACPAGQACVEDDGSRCRSDCGGGRIADERTSHRVCDGGVVRMCSELADPATHCNACGCPAGGMCSSTLTCTTTNPCECIVQQPVGGACETDAECTSGNCSSFARVCRVAPGATCTASNCDFCQTYSDGSSYCSRLCHASDAECGAGGICLGFADTDHYTCSPRCSGASDASCHATCIHPGGGSADYFCSCSGAACNQEEDMHAPLAPCAAYGDTHCATGACLGRTITGATDAFTWGYCSDPCATDADCGAAGLCVNVPCTGADTDTCGLQCLPRCESGECYGRGACTSMPGAAGANVMACFVAPM